MKRVWTLVALFIGGTIVMSHTSIDARSGSPNVGSPAGQVRARAQERAQGSSGADAIKPFRVHFPDEALADLKRRIAATRWPEKETVTDQSQGVQLATVQKLARYWATDYNWRKCDRRFDRFSLNCRGGSTFERRTAMVEHIVLFPTDGGSESGSD